jgi:hypothetical protein
MSDNDETRVAAGNMLGKDCCSLVYNDCFRKMAEEATQWHVVNAGLPDEERTEFEREWERLMSSCGCKNIL